MLSASCRDLFSRCGPAGVGSSPCLVPEATAHVARHAATADMPPTVLFITRGWLITAWPL